MNTELTLTIKTPHGEIVDTTLVWDHSRTAERKLLNIAAAIRAGEVEVTLTKASSTEEDLEVPEYAPPPPPKHTIPTTAADRRRRMLDEYKAERAAPTEENPQP